MTIDEIRDLTYESAKEIAKEMVVIKDHECFLVDFSEMDSDDPFGYSILVFNNRRHIYYANDYELHHKWKVEKYGRDVLRDYYIETKNNILFTDEELMEPVKSYDDYQAKTNYMRNYYIMRYDHVSAWYIGEEQGKVLKRKRRYYPYFNAVGMAYTKEDVGEQMSNILKHLQMSFNELQNNDEVFREMIRKELANHEAGYTGIADDALDALGLTMYALPSERKKIVKEELQKQIEWFEREG